MLFCIEAVMNMDAVLVHDTEGLADDWPPLDSLNDTGKAFMHSGLTSPFSSAAGSCLSTE